MGMKCNGCQNGAGGFPIPFSMAFQPIFDVSTGAVFAHEALVRGAAGEGARSVLDQVTDDNRYAFDQQCRVKAIELASRLFEQSPDTRLSINFMPNAVYEPRACIRLTLETALNTGFPADRIIFEFTENEQLDTNHLLNILRTYRSLGFKTAIDDFGAGHSGLTLLADFQPDLIKLDMALIRNVDQDKARQAIVRGILNICNDLGVTVIAEGIETAGERDFLAASGIDLMQGYLFAKPQFRGLPAIAEAAWAAAKTAH